MSATYIFLPGLGYTSDMWDKVISNLPKGHNYIKLDLERYCEPDPFSNSLLNFDTYPRYLNIILKSKGIKPPYTLIGHSLGGLISIKYAAEFGKNVDRLVLVSTPLGVSKTRVPIKYRALISSINKSRKAETLFRRFAAAMEFKIKDKNLIDFAKHGHLKSVSQCFLDIIKYDFEKAVLKTQCPVLVIYGVNDKIAFKMGSGKYLYESLSNKKIVPVEGAHSLPLSHPTELAKEITDFLNL